MATVWPCVPGSPPGRGKDPTQAPKAPRGRKASKALPANRENLASKGLLAPKGNRAARARLALKAQQVPPPGLGIPLPVWTPMWALPLWR